MTRIYTKEVEHCGYGCPSYHCDEIECGGGDYQYCDLYKKEIYGNIIVDGFPTFCKLSSKKSDMVDWDRPIGNPISWQRRLSKIGTPHQRRNENTDTKNI